MNYYIWTIGCQMNRAESSEMKDYLDSLGLKAVKQARAADIAVLNTCVVRQNAEDKVTSTLNYLKGLKSINKSMLIAVSGCFVADDISTLSRSFPMVDFFFKPGDIASFKKWLSNSLINKKDCSKIDKICPVNSYIPIIEGCNNFCSYCIVPYRRGRERSKLPDNIYAQAENLVLSGAREITLLGQNVNSYGKDLPEKVRLSDLIYRLHEIPDLIRIRFLTNHPKDMDEDLIRAIAELPKVCHHLCLPLQAGDDDILKAMNRNYSVSDYMSLIEKIRKIIPDIALSTDIIVGFPGESDKQFKNTFNSIKTIGFDAVHVAAYSTREGTLASTKFNDDVSQEDKSERLNLVEELQKELCQYSNNKLIGNNVSVLVEGIKKGKWFGRTYSDKLVFFKSTNELIGKLVNVRINSCTPWSLQGETVN